MDGLSWELFDHVQPELPNGLLQFDDMWESWSGNSVHQLLLVYFHARCLF